MLERNLTMRRCGCVGDFATTFNVRTMRVITCAVATKERPLTVCLRMLALMLIAGSVVCVSPLHALAQKGPETVAPLAEKLIDAVVNISTSQVARGPKGVPLPKVPKGSPFEEFFEDFFKDRGAGPPVRRNVSSLGSGFVVDGKEGLVVTNNHVIADADEIIVNFNDGRKLKVEKVIGRDPKTDLALLKVSPKTTLPEVKFGSSEKIKVGDWVMAIGNPFGLGGSVSVGIISAKQRDINTGPYDDFLQTDAAINKGNSGGPLFNMDGDVIGVNTAIISPTGGSIGIGFSVPSDVAANVVDQLRQFGETRRGWLGVKIQSVSEDIAETLGLPPKKGALISAVTPGSPAATGGVEPGDVIVKFDGKEVRSLRSLPRYVAQTPIDKAVDVVVIRKGQSRSLSVRVGRLLEKKKKVAAKKPKVVQAPKKKVEEKIIGLKVTSLSDGLRKKYKIGKELKGLVVTDVDPQGPARRKNIKAGDVIVEAAQKQIKTISDLHDAIDTIKKAGRRAILLRVEDARGNLRLIAIPFSRPK